MPEQHALLSASGAERWSTCPASVRLEAPLPESSSRYADHGTAAHTVASWCLENEADPQAYPAPSVEVGGVAYPVDREMQEAVALYLQVVREEVKGGTLLVEQRVDFSHWIDVEDSFGTSDAIILKGDTIVVIDLKYGQGVKVDAFLTDGDGKPQINPQLALYALGALYEYESIGDFRYAKVMIVQPRLEHISECEIDITSLKTFALRMKAAARRAMDVYEAVEAPALSAYAPSEKSCQWCRAKHSCPALAADVEEETRDLFGALVEHGGEAMAAAVPDDRLAQAMSKVGLIEDFCKAIRAEVERRLLAGHPVPGFKLIEGRSGARKWKDEKAAEKALRRLLGARDAMKPLEPISPTSVENNFVKKGFLKPLAWQRLQDNIEQSPGKPSVAPADARGTEVRIASTEDRFAALVDNSASVVDDLV